MKLLINGEPHEILRAANVAELIDELAISAAALLVEHNGLALRRDEWATHRLAADDRLELVRLTAGG